MIMNSAQQIGLTSSNYLWLVTQSVVGNTNDRTSKRRSLPPGMLGVHFEVDLAKVLGDFMSLAMKVFFGGAEAMLTASENPKRLDYSMDCQSIDSKHRFDNGADFYKYVRRGSLLACLSLIAPAFIFIRLPPSLFLYSHFQFLPSRHMLNLSSSIQGRKFGVGGRMGSAASKRLFTPGGSIRQAQLKIVNLKPSSSYGYWDTVGTWSPVEGLVSLGLLQ